MKFVITVVVTLLGSNSPAADEFEERIRLSRAKKTGDPVMSIKVIAILDEVSRGKRTFEQSEIHGYGDGGSTGVCFDLGDKRIEVFVPFWNKARFRGGRSQFDDVRLRVTELEDEPEDADDRGEPNDPFAPRPPLKFVSPIPFSETLDENEELLIAFKKAIDSKAASVEDYYIPRWKKLIEAKTWR